MADDIDMWHHIEFLEEEGRDDEAELLTKCHYHWYNERNPEKAEELKEQFREEYGYWNNWY